MVLGISAVDWIYRNGFKRTENTFIYEKITFQTHFIYSTPHQLPANICRK